MPTLVRIQLGPCLSRPCSSVVERTLGKGEVTSSILVTGLYKASLMNSVIHTRIRLQIGAIAVLFILLTTLGLSGCGLRSQIAGGGSSIAETDVVKTLLITNRVSERTVRINHNPVGYDFDSRIFKIGPTLIQYDAQSRIQRIGSDAVIYDDQGQIVQVGHQPVTYNKAGWLVELGETPIIYNRGGGIVQIGSSKVEYDRQGRVIAVEDLAFEYGP